MGATSLTMLRLAWDLEIKPLSFLFSFISVPPTCLDPAASCVVSKRNKEGLSAGITNMTVREDDVHDRDPAYEGHVSAYLFVISKPVVLTHRIDAWTFCFKSVSFCL